MFMYESVTTASTMFQKQECKSLEEALGIAAAHISNYSAFPLKILKDGVMVLDATQIRVEVKTRFGVESRM